MKTIFTGCFLLAIIALVSCHKNKKTSCEGSFVSLGGVSSTTEDQHIYFREADSGQIKGTRYFLRHGGSDQPIVYDINKNCLYAVSSEGYKAVFQYYFATGEHFQFDSSTLLDTLEYWYNTSLIYNSTADKLYLVTQKYQTNRIFELAHASGGQDRKIFEAAVGDSIYSPIVDEHTGYIYYTYAGRLHKIDPETGKATLVRSYTNISPDELQYNKNDGMIYGLNLSTTPYDFIRIDPKDGSVKTLAHTDLYPGDGHAHTFDLCSNRYILSGGAYVRWIEPLSGQVVKRTPSFEIGIYISQPLPL